MLRRQSREGVEVVTSTDTVTGVYGVMEDSEGSLFIGKWPALSKGRKLKELSLLFVRENMGSTAHAEGELFASTPWRCMNSPRFSS